MPIPPNIYREHIFQAMLKINRERVPQRRGPRKWALRYEGTLYPCKLVISYANFYANGVELDPNPRIFTTYLAQDYLQAKGFIVVPFDD